MEINEKTRLNFSGEKALSIIAVVLLTAWGVHTYISKQTERDLNQDISIDKVDSKVEALKLTSVEINNKLDRIIQKQEAQADFEHSIIVKHQYENLNIKR
jgi:hypothetical protein